MAPRAVSYSTPIHPVRLPHDDSAFIDDPQVMFSSVDTVDLLEAAIGDTLPLLPSLHTCPLQSPYSSSQALPPSSSDALPASSITTVNLEEQDPPIEDEEAMREGEGEHEPMSL